MSARPFSDDIRVSATIVGNIRAAGIADDDPDFETLLDSECDAPERVRRVLRAARYIEAQSKALGELQAEMRERKARLDRKAESLRDMALWALGEMGLKRLDAPDFSATVTAGHPRVVVTDLDALPDEACRIERKADKDRLAGMLADGPVPGAEWTNPTPFLSVRSR